ncbi:receptor-like serine/threonine-protein kinase At2g45590 [Mangifera indica]|uniref:receptor-like serine/threonine-protein kinase At2g45590 n=1 Tax=Mangifera indica TaxID=29780 RepID=UPI001CFBAFE6|nr:receptor-like serine/threonine-protein kinase At2g45590 [Mangifera indica]
MPSRSLFSFPPSLPVAPPLIHRHHNHRFHALPVILAGTSVIVFLILLIATILCYRKLSRNRTVPSDLKSPNHNHCRRFSYSLIRRATASFSPSNRLGHGGFGSVYKAVVPSSSEPLAVKILDPAGSLQGEREFHNELSLAYSLNSPHIVSLLGFASDRRGRRLVLVYELMENRSLQDALLDRKCEELMEWKKRFEIAYDIARGLEYLHHSCDPPVIHGDIKPSNILLDGDFNAKIGDFGLARLKTEDVVEGEGGRKMDVVEDNGSILEETESVVTAYEESGGVCGGGGGTDRSSESCVVRVFDPEVSPETSVLSPEVGADKGSASEAGFDRVSIESGKDLIGNGKRCSSRRDWWWKQDNGGGRSESGRVKDYVVEWIGSEIKKDPPKNEWIAYPCSTENTGSGSKLELKKEKVRKKEKNQKPREWWKEEFCEELTKKKKKRGFNSSHGGELWWQKEEEVLQQSKKRKNKSSRGSIDWWLDGFSGELRSGRRNSQDWASGDIPKSGGISSTPSMRGTVCYIAPEYGGGGLLSEKCDVYSFGVLLLVLISGRRPLQVTASPMSEFERANLISWARQLAYNGRLLDLIDLSVHSLDKDQALLCITIALLCLQRSPSKRPTMKEIVQMLSGETEPPHLPFEFSPSPPSNFPFKSRKKAR